MKVLISGANGQLGRALAATAPDRAEIIALPHAEFDIADAAQTADVVARTIPDLIVNAAAYTAVDRAESAYEQALAVNGTAAGQLATTARDIGARFVHVSTDFVFDGTTSTPYRPDSPTSPLGAYGHSKLVGEQAVRAAMPTALILRTAWVYAAQGSNFANTMLRLMRERDEIRVVADQIGTPTHADSLARAIWALDAAGATGIHHWTDAGVASWYDFAVAIYEEARALGLVERDVCLVPIRTQDYPTPARRPGFSVLDKSATWAITGPAAHWRSELREALRQIRD